jgi:hypothetical protein
MGTQSVVTGYISLRSHESVEPAREVIATYPDYDAVWPFTNIFWADSPAQYFSPVVGFAGSYKQIEEVWAEWLWKFSRLLSRLDAYEAVVHLDSIIGTHFWRLRAKRWIAPLPAGERMGSLIGSDWVIVEAPDDDFSIDPEWLAWTEHNLMDVDEQTGQLYPYKWDKFVERGIEPPDS